MPRRKPSVRFGRTDTPPAGTVVGVWYPPEQRIIAAVWDGASGGHATVYWYPTI